MLRLWIAPPTLTTLEEALKILIVINKMEKVHHSVAPRLSGELRLRSSAYPDAEGQKAILYGPKREHSTIRWFIFHVRAAGTPTVWPCIYSFAIFEN